MAAPPPPMPPQTKIMAAPQPPQAGSSQPSVDGRTEVHNDSSASEKLKQASEEMKKKKEQMKQKFETLQNDEKMGDLKGHTKNVLDFLSKIYIFDFFRRLFKKSNIGTILFLGMNLLLYIALFGGFTMPEMIPTAILLYLMSLMIALSPVGEFILRFQSGCKKLSKLKNKEQAQRIQAIFDEVYAKARAFDPSISSKVKLFISRDEDMNAFATGRKTVCLTTGLLKLSDEEIKGVLGHEFGHLAHKDTDLLLVILVSNILLSILFVIIRFIVSIAIFMIGEGESSFGGIGNFIVRILVDLLLLSLIRLWTKLGIMLVMHSSRKNEFEADQFAAELGYGRDLIVGLNAIDDDPFKKGFWATLRSSHPDTLERIERVQQWLDSNGQERVILQENHSFSYQTSKAPMGIAAAFPSGTSSPSVKPPKPRLFHKTEQPTSGSFCFGRYSADGRLHYGKILNLQEGYADFLFYNNVREWIPDNCMVTLKDASEQLQAYGLSSEKGVTSACTIRENSPEGYILVQYHDDGTSEWLNQRDILFVCPPSL
jgi:heat shock protein HtpX